MANKTALVTGATGLVGKDLIKYMLEDDFYSKITVLSRRPLGVEDDRLEVVIIDDFEKIEEFSSSFNRNHVYCCLGTTMKQAGSKEMFKKIDHDYPIQMAEIASKQPDFESYIIVTAVGGDTNSPLFYNQIKGHLETALKEMNLKSLQIFRPSLLLGKRKEFRFGEEVAKAVSSVLSFFVVGSRGSRLWSIKSTDVAKSMLVIAREEHKGISQYNPKEMVELALEW